MSVKRWGWAPQGMHVSTTEQLQFVHYSDYEKLANALREVRRAGVTKHHVSEIAEAALLSAGEEL